MDEVKPLLSFVSADVTAATCLHRVSKAFWQSCMNSNMSCERYVGFIKNAIESGRIKKLKTETQDNFDERLRGVVNLGYDHHN